MICQWRHWSALQQQSYPDVKVEVTVDYGLTDIVAERFDLGIRLGDQVAKDMIAVRIGPNLRLAVVGAPLYFDRHTVPRSPQDLTEHDCINLRLPTYGDLYVLEFEKDGQAVNVRVQGQLAFNSSTPRVRAALAEFGLAFVPEDMVLDHVKDGKLVRVLEDWCPSSPVITPTIRAAGSSLRRSNWSLTPCARAFELTGLYCQSGLAPVPRVPSFRYA